MPKKERKEGDVWSNCLERHDNDSFCQKWAEKGEIAQASRNKICHCIKTADSCCRKWKCISEEKSRYCSVGNRKDKTSARRCKQAVEKIEECVCSSEHSIGGCCSKWTCAENGGDSTTRHGEYYRYVSQYVETSILNASTSFCTYWSGEWTSKKYVGSTSCDCAIIDNGYCESWRCNVRTLLRCSEHRGWCRLELSIGVFGLIGLFFLIGGMVIIDSPNVCCRTADLKTRAKFSIVYSLLLFPPWLASVGITGGSMGLRFVGCSSTVSAILISGHRRWMKTKRSSSRPNDDEEHHVATEEQTIPSSDERAPFLVPTRSEGLP